MSNGGSIQNHAIFEQGGVEPEPQDVVVLIGYNNDVDEETTRIFTGLDFCAWIDVPKAAIVASVADSGNVLLPAVFWVDRTAPLVLGAVESTEAQYLKGPIANRELAGISTWGGGRTVMTPYCSGTHTIMTPLCSGTHI